MLAANVCAADFIHTARHPTLFRVHEGPTPEKRNTLQNYLRSLGLGFTVGEEPRPAELQAIALATRDRPDAAAIHQMLLRSMQQALYTPANSGHFGLAYDAYTHFTSPIRRYPDLLIHRVIKALLGRHRYHLEMKLEGLPPPPAGRGGKAAAAAAYESAAWEAAGAHCSANERRADEASRDVEAWLKCKFMRERLGEEFQGSISAVTGFGLFVQLDELYVEGLVHITELGGEYFRFDEARQELRGERTGVRYAVGGRIRVQVSRVDLDGRKIDFRLVREGETVSRTASGRERAAGSAQAQLEAVQSRDRAARRAAKEGRSGSKAAGRGARGSARPGAKAVAEKGARPDPQQDAAPEVESAPRKGRRTRR